MPDELSGAPVAPSSTLQTNTLTTSSDLVDDLSTVPGPNDLPAIPGELEGQLGGQDESESPQRKPQDSNEVVQDIAGGVYSSVPSAFLPPTLTQGDYSTDGESEQPTPEYNTEVEASSSRSVSPIQPALLHPSLRRLAPPVATSTGSSEDSSEEEINNRKRKRSTATGTKERPAKRVKLRRETKTSAKKMIKLRAEKSPPPPKEKYEYPTPDELPPLRIPHLAQTLPVVKTRSPSPKEKADPSTRPGYPYWGAEHSDNPPKYVSTPIERREEGLHTLMDPPPGERPGYSYVTLIRQAILGSKDKKLTIESIYEQIMGRFEYYRDQNGKCDKGWKNSVRHQMSLSACFEKKEKLLWESGKGVWWTVNETVEGGTKRERKRKPRSKAAKEAQGDQPNGVLPPRTFTIVPDIHMQKRRVDHPLFPRTVPAHLLSQRPAPAQSAISQIPQPEIPRLGPSFTGPSQRPGFSTPFTFTGPTQPSAGPTTTAGMGGVHRPVEGTFRPTPTTTHNSFRPAASSGVPLSHTSSSMMSRAPASVPASSRTPLIGPRGNQGTSSVRGVIHTRWQSSADFHFAATRDDRGDSTDSGDED